MSTSKAAARRHAADAIRAELVKQSNQLDLFPDQIDYSSFSTASLAKQAARLTLELERRMGSREGLYKAEEAKQC